MFMEKSKKSAAGPVDIPMLSGGVNETGSSVISVKDVVFSKPITVLSNVFKTGLYGFANG
jgi:hypothetical protein